MGVFFCPAEPTEPTSQSLCCGRITKRWEQWLNCVEAGFIQTWRRHMDLWQVLGRKRFYRVTSKVCCRGLSEELEISGELEHGTAMVAQNWWIWTSQGRATCRIQGICLALSALSPKEHPCGTKCGAMAVCVVFSTLFSWTGHSAMP